MSYLEQHSRLTLRVQLCEHNCPVGGLAQAAWPPLDGCECGRLQHELLRGFIVRCTSFESTNVRAMAELGLCIGANDLVDE